MPQSTIDALQMWWIESGGHDAYSVNTLIEVVQEEMGEVPAHELEPNLLPLLWIDGVSTL